MSASASFQLGWQARLILVAAVAALSLPLAICNLERSSLDARSRTGEASPDSFAALSDGQCYFSISGPEAGPPVVLVSGLATPTFVWDRTVEGLTAAGFRVLRYDHFGRGLSDRPRGVYNLDLYLRQLSELRERTGFDRPAHLIGLSMGGVIVTGHVLDRPDWIRRVALISPAGYPVPIPAQAQIGALPVLGDWLIAAAGDGLLLRGLDKNLASSELFDDYKRSFTPQLRYAGVKAALLSSLRSMPLAGFRNEFQQAYSERRPLLLIWGTEDQVIPFSNGELMSREIRGARLVPIAGAGHISHWESPTQVNTILIQHLRSP